MSRTIHLDPLFLESFASHSWKYLTYTDIKRLSEYAALTLQEIIATAKPLAGEAGNA